jgi:hypothetical protein
MKVRMLQGLVGERFAVAPKDVVEMSDEMGQVFVERGMALKVAGDVEVDYDLTDLVPSRGRTRPRVDHPEPGPDSDPVLGNPRG